MDTSNLILLAVTASISFALGRTIVYFRDKKRKAEKERLEALAAKARRDAPPEAESKNKSKRKRQLSQQARQQNRSDDA